MLVWKLAHMILSCVTIVCIFDCGSSVAKDKGLYNMFSPPVKLWAREWFLSLVACRYCSASSFLFRNPPLPGDLEWVITKCPFRYCWLSCIAPNQKGLNCGLLKCYPSKSSFLHCMRRTDTGNPENNTAHFKQGIDLLFECSSDNMQWKESTRHIWYVYIEKERFQMKPCQKNVSRFLAQSFEIKKLTSWTLVVLSCNCWGTYTDFLFSSYCTTRPAESKEELAG